MVDQLKEIPKTDITTTKKWEGGPSEKPTVWFKLYKNEAGSKTRRGII